MNNHDLTRGTAQLIRKVLSRSIPRTRDEYIQSGGISFQHAIRLLQQNLGCTVHEAEAVIHSEIPELSPQYWGLEADQPPAQDLQASAELHVPSSPPVAPANPSSEQPADVT